MSVNQASTEELEKIIEVDREVIGHDQRREYFHQAIEEDRCLVVKNHLAIVTGYLIYDTNFFGSSFISLVIVSPTARRKGYATTLLKHFETIAPTEKIFSSTNESNSSMQQVFQANGYVRSGIIENLDEGDPELIYFKRKNARGVS